MGKYTIDELKEAWKRLYWIYWTDGSMWSDKNMELARRLPKDEYAEFVHNN